MPKRWTPVEEAALFQESSKYSVEQLAKKYSVTPKSVAVKLQKLRQAMRKTGVTDVLDIPRQRASVGGEAKRWTPDEEVELLDLHKKGWKTEKIATHFNVSQKAISVKLLKVKKKLATPEPIKLSHPEPAPHKMAAPSVKEVVKPGLTKPTQKPVEPPHKPPTTKMVIAQPTATVKPPHRSPGSTSTKHQEGEANTQFKVWNGTEWITIKVPRRLIHV